MEQRRREMVALVRRGMAQREVARRFGVSLSVVQRWAARAGKERLSRADLASRRSGPGRPANKTPRAIERRILELRRELAQESALGECGALAIREALLRGKARPVPSLRTIGRVLLREGALDGRRRIRRPAPPRGWHLPKVARGLCELDSFDHIEQLRIEEGPLVDVLNGISLHGHLVLSEPVASHTATARHAVKTLVSHWRRHGLPAYAQFDNGTIFQGAHQWPDSFGRVTRLCLALGVVPVFAPPREQGFQAQIESYNGRWQRLVWRRWRPESLAALRHASRRFVAAHNDRKAAAREGAPRRRPFPRDFDQEAFLKEPLRGLVIFIRRTDEAGSVSLLGHRFAASPAWQSRLVRADVNLTEGEVRFYALRRAEPEHQPLLSRVPYTTPQKPFKG